MTESRQLGTALDALSHPYRRQLLIALSESNPQYADGVPSGDGDAASTAPEIEQYHAHLPKLASLGFIEWDRETGEVCRGPNWDAVAPAVELIETHGDELPDDWR